MEGSAKKVGQKRRPLRRRSVLRTDCTRRHLTGIHVKGSVKGNGSCRCAEGQRQMSLRGASNIAYRLTWASQHEIALAVHFDRFGEDSRK